MLLLARWRFLFLAIPATFALFVLTPCGVAQRAVLPYPPALSGSAIEALPASAPASNPQPGSQQVLSDASGRDDTSPKSEPPPTVDPAPAQITGTVTDTNGDIVPNANITLDGPRPEDHRTTLSSDGGAFHFAGLQAGLPYRVTISAKYLQSWNSGTILLSPGQFYILNDIKLKVPVLVASVMVYATREQIATEQVTVAEKQRVFGFIPNFFVTYDPEPVPLTTKLKFRLALKADTDPMTFLGVAFMATIYQAGDLPDYGQGWDAFAKRVGAGYADTTSDVFLGGAILPWLLRQDPRYFYQGTGTKKSRAWHAIASPFVCKGDNGKTQPNYSSLGGDLASGALSNLYYPDSNRGAKLVLGGFAITTSVRVVKAVVQEFVLRNLTPAARAK